MPLVVSKVYECTHGVFIAQVVIPRLGPDPVPYNLKKDLEWDDTPEYQELAARLIAGEFDAIVEPCPKLANQT